MTREKEREKEQRGERGGEGRTKKGGWWHKTQHKGELIVDDAPLRYEKSKMEKEDKSTQLKGERKKKTKERENELLGERGVLYLNSEVRSATGKS